MKYAKSVRVTVLYEVMPQRIKAVLDNLGAFVFLLLCYIIVAKGCTHIQMVREFKQATPMLGLPQYIPYLILPIAFSLTAMRLLQEIWKNVRESGWLNVFIAGLLMAALFVPVYLADEEGKRRRFHVRVLPAVHVPERAPGRGHRPGLYRNHLGLRHAAHRLRGHHHLYRR